MFYTQNEIDLIEEKWAFHLYGRSAFMSRDDFLQLQDWAKMGIPAEVIVNAISAYFRRRSQRNKKTSFVKLNYLSNDVDQEMKKHLTIFKEKSIVDNNNKDWDLVNKPARFDSHLKFLYEKFKNIQAVKPPLDAPDFLDYFTLEQQAAKDLVKYAERYVKPELELLKQSLYKRLLAANIPEDTIIWDRAWEQHWMHTICTELNIAL